MYKMLSRVCKLCEETLHRVGKRRIHRRPLVCKKCKNQAIMQCIACIHNICHNCSSLHSSHDINLIASQKRVGAFLHLSTCKSARSEDIQWF